MKIIRVVRKNETELRQHIRQIAEAIEEKEKNPKGVIKFRRIDKEETMKLEKSGNFKEELENYLKKMSDENYYIVLHNEKYYIIKP